MKTALITIAHRRELHLRRQLDGVTRGFVRPDRHVVVALDDPDVSVVVADVGSAATVVEVAGDGGPLALAAARNAGATAALDDGAEVLVFLDVDCIPGPGLLARYRDVAGCAEHRHALLCGDVTYLPPPGPAGYPIDLHDWVNPHPGRPTPSDADVIATEDYHLFWSLSFALRADTWQRIGGFCERYRGYGGEDTDFGQMAKTLGVPMRWIGGAHAFHQHHPVSDPPVEHVADIVRNANVFHDRWRWWPMEGWLSAFDTRGLIHRDLDGRPHRGPVGVSHCHPGRPSATDRSDSPW